MSFQDTFKSSFGLFIFLVYKKAFAGVMYSSGFGVTLVAMTRITTLVILAVTSNVVLSLGMVGALSIVRFRNYVSNFDSYTGAMITCTSRKAGLLCCPGTTVWPLGDLWALRMPGHW